MIKVIIDQKEINVENGTTVLEAALSAGIKIPTLCYNKELTSYGACRLCLVEVVKGGRPGIYASCLFKVTDGLEIKTDTERVIKTRKIILELLLARSPQSEKVKKLAARIRNRKKQIYPEESGKLYPLWSL